MNQSNQPLISVIIPTFNDARRIGDLLDSLLKQSFSSERFEIIVVDNNSQDNTTEVIASSYPGVICLSEKNKQSSYAARNTGIKAAKGEILAFIDSDCIAHTDWLKNAYEALQDGAIGMLGGKVQFYFSAEKTAAECYDALTGMRNEWGIRHQGISTTANLIVRRHLFDQFGLFNEEVKSGGDVQWTGEASKQGAIILFDPTVMVLHPARTLSQLIKKNQRTGKGRPHIWVQQGKSLWQPRDFLRAFLPKPVNYVRELINQSEHPDFEERLFSIWAVASVCSMVFHWSALQEAWRIKRTRDGGANGS